MNRLAGETSPYLLQHAENPVDWFPWGDEALAVAESEERPIFLSIGYSACHWCHVMERESFEDAGIAALLNANFVSIKVDREERPDLDSIYMDAVQAMTGQGGWPLSAFLAPDGRPFFAGTYFPKEAAPVFRRSDRSSRPSPRHGGTGATTSNGREAGRGGDLEDRIGHRSEEPLTDEISMARWPSCGTTSTSDGEASAVRRSSRSR